MTLEEDFEEAFAKHHVMGYMEYGFVFYSIYNLIRLGSVTVLNERFCET